MTQHTPGPWYCRSNPAQRYPVVFSGKTKVARAVTSKLSQHEIEANINLISAAPDMLAALERILYAHDNHGNGAAMGEAILCRQYAEMARAAINKAKGL